jgi:ElaB/YqjD/DUF883 family membrane-anchored ribosome-binding protein
MPDISPVVSPVTRDKLIADVNAVIADAEDLLHATASATGEKVAEVRERAAESIRRARAGLRQLQDAVAEKTTAAARATDDYVHKHPWQAAGVAAGIGLLIGLLLGRR